MRFSVPISLKPSFTDFWEKAALTKLSYLLSKPELSVQEVRKLMAAPLRGELTMLTPPNEDLPSGVQGVQQVLNQLLRLTAPPMTQSTPTISIESVSHSHNANLSAKARDITASWSLTDSDTVQAGTALLPFLVHIAAAKNDSEGILFCITASDGLAQLQDGAGTSPNPGTSPSIETRSFLAASSSGVGSGICNVRDTSGRTPLHTAAVNGSLECTRLLLENGASVHARDLQDHTVLYYVSFRSISHSIEEMRDLRFCSLFDRVSRKSRSCF